MEIILLLGMNIFVAFFVLLLLLAESTPRAASSIPLIGKLFLLFHEGSSPIDLFVHWQNYCARRIGLGDIVNQWNKSWQYKTKGYSAWQMVFRHEIKPHAHSISLGFLIIPFTTRLFHHPLTTRLFRHSCYLYAFPSFKFQPRFVQDLGKYQISVMVWIALWLHRVLAKFRYRVLRMSVVQH